MRTKSSEHLNLRNNSDPQPSIEVDRDSIPDELSFPDILCDVMVECAVEEPSSAATVYTYFGPSINFHEPTNSAFIAVIGGGKTLERIRNAFARIPGVRVRFSDYIRTSNALPQLHIEAATVWLPYEPGTWHALGSATSMVVESDDATTDPRWDLDDAFAESDEEVVEEVDADGESVSRGKQSVPVTPLRVRAARSDASVGSIVRTIERIFDLPEGSVALCGPERKALRRDARIATLRKRWE